jgi:hypothetical protein
MVKDPGGFQPWNRGNHEHELMNVSKKWSMMQENYSTSAML